MPRLSHRLVPFALLVAAALAGGCASNRLLPLTSTPASPVDLTGTWQLDPSRSEDPAQKLALEQGGQGGGGRGGHGGGHGGGGHGGGFGGGGMGKGGGGGGSGAAGSYHGVGNPDGITKQTPWPTHLVIAQDATTLHVDGDNVRREVPLSSKGSSDSRDPITGWYGNDFVVETGDPERMQVTQRYSLSADGHQLSIRTDLRTKRMKEPVTVWRVFGRVAPQAP